MDHSEREKGGKPKPLLGSNPELYGIFYVTIELKKNYQRNNGLLLNLWKARKIFITICSNHVVNAHQKEEHQ